MTTVVVPRFSESWRYAGWTSTQESAAGGAVDSSGDLVLCGKSNGLAFSIDDDSVTTTYSADFAAVKLQGTTGEELWTWEDSSADGADWMVSAGTDGNDNVRAQGALMTTTRWCNENNSWSTYRVFCRYGCSAPTSNLHAKPPSLLLGRPGACSRCFPSPPCQHRETGVIPQII